MIHPAILMLHGVCTEWIGRPRRVLMIIGRARRAVAMGMVAMTTSACHSPAEIPPELPPVGTDVGMLGPALVGETLAGAAFSLGGSTEPTVLVFYRSAQCGLCRVQLNELQRHLPGYQRLGVRPVAVTLDDAETSQQLLENSFDFNIVSVDSVTFEAWGAFDPQTGVAMPLTYILDGNGVVRFRHRGRNASDRALDAELLTVLETLNLAP